VPVDRAATLRTAEKLLRQGKLDPAIAEYARVVEDHPRDWNTANLLGDLYVRSKRIDLAVQQFRRLADRLNEEGFFPKAAAVYKKLLKLKPDDEHSLVQSAELASTQGLLADARSFLNTLAELRQTRGDKRGAAQARIRLGSLDPADYDARIAAARARIEVGDAPGAARDLKEIAAELSEKGRGTEAIEALRQAAEINPEDQDVRERLFQIYLSTGDFTRARQCAVNAQELKALASALESAKQADEALAVLSDAARLDPADSDLRTHLARTFVARGDVDAAAEYLTTDTAGDDPKLLMTVAEIRLRAGAVEEGIGIAQRLLAADPSRRQTIALLAWKIADQSPEAGYQLVEVAAEASVAEEDWASAAAALQEFVTRVPSHIPALMRLVEICVDGGLEATMYSAQAQLADAYIAAGSAAEARVIAEDLVAREPWERSNIERFRKALELLGEPDPDSMIAERLSGQSPFTSTDMSIDFSDLPDQPPPVKPAAPSKPAVPAPAAAAPAPAVSKPAPKAVERKPAEAPKAAAAAPAATADVEQVLARMRDASPRQPALTEAQDQYGRGVALQEAGKTDEAMPLLEAASRAPSFRFSAASRLARIYRDRGMIPQAIEWYERAAQAPPSDAKDGHMLLYDLADALESVGEVARALAVCLELQAEAGEYRDVNERIDRLARVQTRG